MLKISDFSRLGRVSVRMLRHYEKVGLLAPVRVDRATGYRYYSVAQLPRLNRILALKDLGFSLEQVSQLLSDTLPAAYIRRMLETKQDELEHRLREEQARLQRVASRLRQIEQEGRMSTYDIVIKRVEPQVAASAREVVASVADMSQRCGEMAQAAYRLASEQGYRVTGACMAIYHDEGGYREKQIDTEMAVPVDGHVSGQSTPVADGVARLRELPGVETMASVVHHGAYDTLMQAYTALGGWIEANAYRVAGPCREIYLQGPETGTPVTELQFPVAKS